MAAKFTAKTAYNTSHPDAIAVYCSDGRITASVDELLKSLGHPRLDTLTIPGGPGLFNHRTSGFSDCDTFSHACEFLVREHHIRTAVLLAHEGCGYYARRFPDLDEKQIEVRQKADLRLAMAELVATHPRLEALGYFSRIRDKHVHFERVTIK